MEYDRLHEIENLDLLFKLIDMGLDPNALDNYGLTPLHYCDNPAVAQVLILNGADPNIKTPDGLTVLDLTTDPRVKSIVIAHQRALRRLPRHDLRLPILA